MFICLFERQSKVVGELAGDKIYLLVYFSNGQSRQQGWAKRKLRARGTSSRSPMYMAGAQALGYFPPASQETGLEVGQAGLQVAW